MVETVNYQCPACGGPLHYVGSSGMLQCDYCDSKFTAEQVEKLYSDKQNKAEDKAEKKKNKENPGADTVVATGTATAAKNAAAGLDPIQAFLQRDNWDDPESATLTSSICSSCGAELIHDQTTAVTQCPYCGNNSVIPGTMGGTLKPDYVIPFKLDKDEAVAALKKYYRGKKFLPKEFGNKNHLEKVQGVYVPFWLYSATTDANAEFSAENVRSWRQGDYQITETDHYAIYRRGKIDFTRVPVDGSQKMPDAHMDAIEPFDYSEMKPFNVAYLPGYLTDRYDLDIATCQPRAYNRMATSSEMALEETVVGYASVTPAGCNVSADWTDVSYALLPVWMLHTKWNGKDFLFAMNGQTGKFIGDLPIDKGRVVGWFLKISLPLMAIFGAAAFVM